MQASAAGVGAAPRLAAARAALAVLDQGRALDEALESLLADFATGRDRALTRRLVHAVLRDWPALNYLIGQMLEKPLKSTDRIIHFLLAVALSELRESREPDHAVVHASVDAAATFRGGRLRGLVNGMLRRYLRERASLESGLGDDPALKSGYPRWLIDRISADWPDRVDAILEEGNRPPPLWLRVNRRHWQRDEAVAALVQAGFEPSLRDGFVDAVVLNQRARISDLPGFAEGGLSVQDGAAQLVVDYLDLADGQRVLDACAAPGGKSAHILERADVDLTAVEIDADRLARVGEGLDRLSLKARRLVTGDATQPEAWWDGEPFDRILVDAPCSATGVIRRHPDIRWLRRSEDIDALVETQRKMLDALWPLLRPGGILVYATCSVLNVENAAQARDFLQRHADAELFEPAALPGRPISPGRQLLPGDHGADGFYHFAARRL